MKSTTYFSQLESKGGFYAILAGLGFIILLALGATHHMESHGHYVTGMNNQIVWGMPHVFAIFLIVAASGALNVASISSVFDKKVYKPLARMSAVLAVSLLAGGLVVLVLDLGRPDRLIVAMTTYNFKSIFAWNIILYNGFFAIVIAYLWTMMDKSVGQFSKLAGVSAFVWRLILTTGTGSIFGFLVARQGYDAAIMAPMFIVMSFSFGLAIFILLLMATYNWTNRPLGDVIVNRMGKLLGVFIAAVFYMVVVYHVTNLYGTENHELEAFLLLGHNGGGVYAMLFWVVQLLIGTFAPLALLLLPRFKGNRKAIAFAAALAIVGGLAQVYVIVIGGQAFPLDTFPGKEVTSAFFDGVSHGYSPTIWEIMLGLGGTALSLAIFVFAARALSILPVSLADSEVDPHH